MAHAVDVTVTGQVQGVFFRAQTRERAGRLGVTGWVRNDPDGSVSAHFEGDQEAVATIVEWCHEGPPHARVERVDVQEVEPTGAQEFEVR